MHTGATKSNARQTAAVPAPTGSVVADPADFSPVHAYA